MSSAQSISTCTIQIRPSFRCDLPFWGVSVFPFHWGEIPLFGGSWWVENSRQVIRLSKKKKSLNLPSHPPKKIVVKNLSKRPSFYQGFSQLKMISVFYWFLAKCLGFLFCFVFFPQLLLVSTVLSYRTEIQ